MLVLTNESQAKFDELHQSYIQNFLPATVVEADLIDQMVAAQWRLRRIWIMQTAAFDLKMDAQDAEINRKFKQIDQPTRATVAFTTMANEEKSLDLLLRYETAYTRMYQRALNTLLRLRKENSADLTTLESTTPELPEAQIIEFPNDAEYAPDFTGNACETDSANPSAPEIDRSE